MLTLGIETSCDETAAAVVADGTRVLASVVMSQIARHRPHGGVVPEIAAREHVTHLVPVIEEALSVAGASRGDLDLVAVTDRPGLLSALLCGVASAQAAGLVFDVPVCGVNHIEAHLVAPFLHAQEVPRYPFVSLVVSGGHTHLFWSEGPLDHRLMGATLDDAAGEAFDKVAKTLGLGYPGGPAVQAAATSGNPRAIPFKRPTLDRESLDFSFSGLKTAVLYRCFGQGPDGRRGAELLPGLSVKDVAASFQAVVVDVLVEKLRRAVAKSGQSRVAVGGGVACNGPLRGRLSEVATELGWELWMAPPALCTDNAAMVASRGAELFRVLGDRVPAPKPSARVSWRRL